MFGWLKRLWTWGDKPKNEAPVVPVTGWLASKEKVVVPVKQAAESSPGCNPANDLLSPLNPLSPIWIGHQHYEAPSASIDHSSSSSSSSSASSDWSSSASDGCSGASDGCTGGGGDF